MADPIYPAISTSESGFTYYVGAQQMHEAYAEASSSQPWCPSGDVSASLDEADAGPVGMDMRYHIRVGELVYPGLAPNMSSDTSHPGDSVPIEDKWLYVFRDETLVVEAQAIGQDEWSAKNRETDEAWESDGEIYLDPGPEGDEHSYTLFLSPVQLSDDAIDFLASTENLSSAGVTVTANQMGAYVAVLDPMHWAALAHQHYYLPLLKSWKDWLGNERRQAKRFVASAIKQWIEADDALGVANDVRDGQPDRWLKRYEEDEAALRAKAEQAAAYLAHTVDSVGYVTIEMACMDRGGQALSHAFQAMACVTCRLAETEPGRVLATRLVEDQDRLPAKFLFVDQSHQNSLDFGVYRYAWLAVLSVFKDLAPLEIARLAAKGQELQPAMENYLRSVHIEGTWSKWRNAYRHVVQGQEIPTDLCPKKRVRFQETLRRLEEVSAPETLRAVEFGQQADKFHSNFAEVLGPVAMTTSFVLEVVNLGLAVSAFLDAKPGDRNKALISVVGASADFAVLLTEVGERMMMEGAEETAEGVARSTAVSVVKGLGGFAMIVSGVCDGIGFYQDSSDAVGQHDYNAAVGAGIATIGAGASVIGGGMMLGEAMGFAACGGPAGVIVGVVGAVLIVGGTAAYAWLKDTPHETFVKHSFVGSAHGESSFKPIWSPHSLPCRSPLKEAEVLVALLSHFKMSIMEGIGAPSLTIRPGMLAPDSILDIEIDRRWTNQSPLNAQVSIHPDTEQALMVSGEELTPGCSFYYDDDGQLKSIYLKLEPARSRSGLPQRNGITVRGRIRVLPDKGLVTPTGGRKLQVYTARFNSISSESSGSSFDEDLVVDG